MIFLAPSSEESRKLVDLTTEFVVHIQQFRPFLASPTGSGGEYLLVIVSREALISSIVFPIAPIAVVSNVMLPPQNSELSLMAVKLPNSTATASDPRPRQRDRPSSVDLLARRQLRRNSLEVPVDDSQVVQDID